MSTSVALSVVIPTYQRCESLYQVLCACGQQSLAPEQYEVIVSIDGSTDATETMLTQLHTPYRLRWLSMPNAGAATARTRGATSARGEIIVFLDDDVIPAPNLLAEHLAGHSDETELVGLGHVQQVLRRPLSGWERYLCERYQEHYHKLALPGYQPDFWDCLAGNLSLNRQLWVQCGGFDGALERHEDTELGYRLFRAGARFMYLPQAVGYHHFVRSTDGGLRDAFREGKSAMQLTRRHRELAPRLLYARWKRYPILGQALMRCALADPHWQACLAAIACAWAKWINLTPFPFRLCKCIYQLAFHLHFWQGVRAAEHMGATRAQNYYSEMPFELGEIGRGIKLGDVMAMCEPPSLSNAATTYARVQ